MMELATMDTRIWTVHPSMTRVLAVVATESMAEIWAAIRRLWYSGGEERNSR
jgi:hypothetical protein